MSNLPISQLPEILEANPDSILVIVESGTTYQIPFSALTSQIFNNVGDTYVPVLSGNNTYYSSKIFQISSGSVLVNENPPSDIGGTELFGIHAGNTTSPILTSQSGNINSFLASSFQNTNSGHTASTDIVIIGDGGNINSNYVDMGINSSTYSGFTGYTALGGPSDAYMFSSANDLYIGNASPGKRLVFFNGGFDTTVYSKMFMHPDGTITINTDQIDVDKPSAFYIVNANNTSNNMIYSESNINNFAAINSTNTSSGNTASADIIAANDLGDDDTSLGFIDMGINSSNYNATGDIGHASDGYLFSTGNDLYIGNASSGRPDAGG